MASGLCVRNKITCPSPISSTSFCFSRSNFALWTKTSTTFLSFIRSFSFSSLRDHCESRCEWSEYWNEPKNKQKMLKNKSFRLDRLVVDQIGRSTVSNGSIVFSKMKWSSKLNKIYSLVLLPMNVIWSFFHLFVFFVVYFVLCSFHSKKQY